MTQKEHWLQVITVINDRTLFYDRIYKFWVIQDVKNLRLAF
jgi:hypothetical protein